MCLLIFTIEKSKAQNSDSTELANLSAELDALFSDEADSLSLFTLIDSLLSVPIHKHQISVRVGYSNRVTTAGRDFGIDQQGISPGISYYHKSGFYGDVTGVWNSELDPKYYVSIATLGYLGSIGKKWSYSTSFDHLFYHSTDIAIAYPLENSLSGSISHDFKFAYTSLNYSYLFGDESAHQLTWNLTGVIKRKGFKPFKSISILPTFSILWGNQNLTYQNIQGTMSFIKNLTNKEIRSYFEAQDLAAVEKRKGTNAIIRLRDNLNKGVPLSRQQRQVVRAFSSNFQINDNSFGLLNYFISLPISFSADKFNVLVSYNYNIPNSVKGSDTENEPSNGFFSFTVSYNFGF